MPDGTTPPPTTDQQIDTEVRVHETLDALPKALGVITAITGIPLTVPAHDAGGGGEGGQYTLSLAELDVLIGRWTVLRHQIEQSGERITRSMREISPAAEDTVSERFAAGMIKSMRSARDHNTVMWKYADGYVQKFSEARARYAGTEDSNSAALSGSA